MKCKPIPRGVIIAALVCAVLPVTFAYASATIIGAGQAASASEQVFAQATAQNSASSSAQAEPQPPNPDDPRFAAFVYAVVSIKPYKDDPKATVHWMGSQDSPDGFTMHNAPMALMISQAYRTEHSRLAGAPDWVKNERYDVEAKMDPEVADALQKLSPADQKLARQHMLRVLVRDYLKVAFHMETTQVSIYELEIGKNGPKLKAADPNAPEQGMRVSGSGGITTWDAKGTKLSSMMGQLSYVMGRPVYDKTGLTEKYDFTLKYTPDRTASAGAAVDNPAPPDEAPPITIAIEEQLGLKLVSGKGPMDSIVIDHVERPSGN
jgi:uncharacterized protein (TIGR03435 family)